jgi:hypothetical protein
MMDDPNDPPYPDDPNDPEYTLDPNDPTGSPTQSRRKRPDTGSEEWVRMRKANHVRPHPYRVYLSRSDEALPHSQKEVERRRRGNINEGINALAAIMPNDAGESKVLPPHSCLLMNKKLRYDC